MQFEFEKAIEVLSRTPQTLSELLRDLPDEWVRENEGPETWSAFDIVGHLIHGEKTDWIPRAIIILEEGDSREFSPFDRFAQFKASEGKTLEDLLDTFTELREKNLKTLRELKLTSKDFELKGRHPAFGAVTMGQLLSTWVVHDLNHIGQIARVMSKQYKDHVGPWKAYMRILQS